MFHAQIAELLFECLFFSGNGYSHQTIGEGGGEVLVGLQWEQATTTKNKEFSKLYIDRTM